MTSMREYLHRIASFDQGTRRHELVSILDEIGCSYTLYREQIADYQPENVAVRFHEDDQRPRLVIGAHYDSVRASTGANDNGAAVCVLLMLLKSYMHQPPSIPLDIVFFDLEEYGHLGSLAYIERCTAASIAAMINLDICGVGNTLLCAPDRYARTTPFVQPLRNTLQKNALPCYLLPTLPASDDRSFEKAGIPNLSLCMIPESDLKVMAAAMHALQRPSILDTFHNGCRDAAETVEDEAMQSLLHWMSDFLQYFEADFNITYRTDNTIRGQGEA